MNQLHLAVVTQPRGSSGLGGYLVDAFRRSGLQVDVVDALQSKLHKLPAVLKSLHYRPDQMWKRRWENTLYSSWAWRRNSARNGRMLSRIRTPGMRILQVGKEYFPESEGGRCEYDLFILYTMKLSLMDGITPWLPPPEDRPAFLQLETELYQSARLIFTGGGYVKPHLVQEYGISPHRVVVAGGGVHPYYLEHAVDKVPDRLSNHIVFVGWDFGMKGGSDLLDGFAAARAERPRLTLTIAGPARDQWIQQDGVHWAGPVSSKEDLIRLYRGADLFVMPSLRDSFGFVFLEAMTQGVPCIATDLNAMPEIVRHGESGYIVPLRDPQALAASILEFYKDPALRKTLGQAALERVQKHYTWDSVASRIIPHW